MNLLKGLEKYTTFIPARTQAQSQEFDPVLMSAHSFRTAACSGGSHQSYIGGVNPVKRLPGPPAILAWRLASQEVALAN